MLRHNAHDSLMADLRAYMESRIILTASELDIFTFIDERPSTTDEISQRKGFNRRALARLLDAVTAAELLKKEGQTYSVTERGRLLSSRHPETVLPMALHMNRLWSTWGDLSNIVRKGGKGKRKHRDTRDDFIGAMDVVGRALSVEIAATYDLNPFQRLLDIGGASGTYTVAFLRKNPHMKAVIFDLNEVIPLAQKRITVERLTQRVDFVAGDFYRDELPEGCDLVLLSAIIHQNGPKENLNLFRKIEKALIPGGAVLIRDHIMDETRTVSSAGALFAINMLVNTVSGNTYTFREIKDGLKKAGFRDIRLVRAGAERMDGLVEARKPASS